MFIKGNMRCEDNHSEKAGVKLGGGIYVLCTYLLCTCVMQNTKEINAQNVNWMFLELMGCGKFLLSVLVPFPVCCLSPLQLKMSALS